LGAAPNPWQVTFSKNGGLMAVVNLPLNATPNSPISISMFSVDGNGLLTPAAGSPFAVPDAVNSVAFNESGTLLAATSGLNTFLIYAVSPTGTLSLLSTNSTVAEVTLPLSVAFSPTSDLLAVAFGANVVATYAISPAGDATLTGFAEVSSPQSVAFNPSGTLLATANLETDNVSVIAVAPDGSLTPVGDFSTGAGSGPVSVAFSPNGQLLATANTFAEKVSMFSVAPTGVLTPVPGSPFMASFTTNAGTRQVNFHPSGTLLAVANPGGNTGHVRLMSVAANGALGVVQDIDPAFAAVSAAFSPNGAFLATAQASINTVIMYRTGPPKVTIITPAANGLIGPALPTFPVKTNFSCTNAPYGPGIASCVDQSGNPSGTAIDTSVPGPRVLTVTATSNDQQTTTSTIDYTVIAGPTATISSPVGGGVYLTGQVVPTSFSCDSAPGGPSIVFCQDNNGGFATSSGHAHESGTGTLNTATVGAKTYTVNTCAGAFCTGGHGTTSISYTVVDAIVATTLTVPAVPAGGLIESAMTATTTLTRADAGGSAVGGQPVVFTWVLPGGSLVTQTATTDASGVASVAYTPTTRGVHSVAASFEGSPGLLASSTPAALVSVYQRTALQIAPVSVSAGSVATLTATLTSAPSGFPLGAQVVTFTFSGPGAPADQTAVTNGSGSAAVSVVLPSPGTVTATASFLNGAAFYTNSAGAVPPAAETASAAVTVTDATPPVIASHPDISTPATNAAGATVTYTAPAANDDVSTGITAVCGPSSGSVFPLGPTTVTCTATDEAGNSASTSFLVTVTNNAPTFTPPADITVAAASAAGAAVTFTAAGSDVEQGVIPAVCAPPSGSTFPVGVTTVACTVTDAAGAMAAGSFTVTVTFTEPDVPGEMRGDGFVRDDDANYHFVFHVRERASGAERARLSLRVDDDGRGRHDKKDKNKKRAKARDDRFESRSVDVVQFSDDPTIRPYRDRRRAPRPHVDTVLFSGTGAWNGAPNYRYEVFAQDGDHGRGRHQETVRMTIRNPQGQVVVSFEGELDGGNIRSMRIRH
ncbi:MAG: HYR domain-containing protein, partial [Vicinamibacterales bacterium]